MATEWVKSARSMFFDQWVVVYRVQTGISKFNISKDAQGWWYLSKQANKTDEDLGPFSSKEAAAACFETLV